MTTTRLLQCQFGEIRKVIFAEDDQARFLSGPATVRDLALTAIERKISLRGMAASCRTEEKADLRALLDDGALLPPIDHPDSARMILAGTGLTHLGSASGRDAMHKAAAQEGAVTDSMRMFLEGVEGGKPPEGVEGQQPEWFYKGDGQGLVRPEQPFQSPSFGKDAGEEPELAGIYLIGEDGTPWRLGVTLANEFSDHVTERHNYLWLAHSKLRQASLGAELLLGTPPSDIRGTSRIIRNGTPIWEKPFLTGEDNMSHHLSNLEKHHFKYPGFRRPGDIHVHFFGTATLSFSDGVSTLPGDIFEIEAAPFTLPLRNPLSIAAAQDFEVHSL